MPPGAPIVLYTGTFEAYQGLDLLFAAMRPVLAACPDARLVMAGGHADQVERARREAERQGIAASTVFVGERPAGEIPAYLAAADVLVSPRSRGKNTPLKIYQYLRSGKPIVATNLLTHTQVLDSSVAELTDATADAFGAGILRVLRDREHGAALSRAAQALADTRYTYDAYVEKTREALRPIAGAAGAGDGMSDEHYSYRLYADPEMADRFDAMRFSGPIGTLLAEAQDEVIASFLGPLDGRAVLDVGTGTGRAAIGLARRGARVTGIDASAEMLRVARERAAAGGVDVTFDVGDAHRLAFADRAFHAAVSLRVLMHTPDWKQCLAELCRVADDRVVFDYPAAFSAAALQSWSRRLLAAAGRNVEAYRVMSSSDVRRTLDGAGFRVERVHRQFVLPIALHKTIGSRAFTVRVEQALAAVGLLRLLGSPVTVVAVRCAR